MTVVLRLSSLYLFVFSFVNGNVSFHWFIFFVESSWHLRWLETVFPNSNRLFSQIPLSSPSPQNKMSNWITQFHLIVMPHTLFRILVFWSKPEWESFDCKGRKLGFERFEYTCSRWELKKNYTQFSKKLEFKRKNCTNHEPVKECKLFLISLASNSEHFNRELSFNYITTLPGLPSSGKLEFL